MDLHCLLFFFFFHFDFELTPLFVTMTMLKDGRDPSDTQG